VLASRIRGVFTRRRLDEDFRQELDSHLDFLTDENIRGGMTPEEGGRAARMKLGGITQLRETHHELHGLPWIETLAQDIRYALRKNPGFTVVAILTLALGIGATTAIFSVVNAVLLRPLPYQEADRLVVILHYGSGPVSPANFIDWRSQNHAFERMGAVEYWTPISPVLISRSRFGRCTLPRTFFPCWVFPPFSVVCFFPKRMCAAARARSNPEFPRLATPLWWRLRHHREVHCARWRKVHDRRGDAARLQVRAVLGDQGRALGSALFTGRETERGGNSLRLFARLKPGVTLEQARAEMANITSRLEREYPGTNRDYIVLPLKEKVVGDIQPALLVLLGAVSFVLFIACANVAHMLLARSAAGQREVAVRRALGAARSRMIRQFLTESLLLTLLSAGAGLLLALWGIRVLVKLSPASIPRVDTVTLDAHVLLFTLAMAVLTGVCFGIAPAVQASAVNLTDSLKEGGRGSTEGFHRNRLRSLLVASEFALALILLVGAGLMIRSFVALQSIDPGFNPDHVLSMVVSSPVRNRPSLLIVSLSIKHCWSKFARFPA
jgi:putative ABC transport system permease protein